MTLTMSSCHYVNCVHSFSTTNNNLYLYVGIEQYLRLFSFKKSKLEHQATNNKNAVKGIFHINSGCFLHSGLLIQICVAFSLCIAIAIPRIDYKFLKETFLLLLQRKNRKTAWKETLLFISVKKMLTRWFSSFLMRFLIHNTKTCKTALITKLMTRRLDGRRTLCDYDYNYDYYDFDILATQKKSLTFYKTTFKSYCIRKLSWRNFLFVVGFKLQQMQRSTILQVKNLTFINI